MAKLTFTLEDGQEIVVALAERTTLGRANGNDVVVDDPRISAQHAEIARRGDGTYNVRDLGSKAGTFVNEKRVKQAVIASGDTVAFGPLTGVFQIEEVVPPAPAPAASNGKKPDAGPVDAPTPDSTSKGAKREREAKKSPAVEKPRMAEAVMPVAVETPHPSPPKPAETDEQVMARLESPLKARLEKLHAERVDVEKDIAAAQSAAREATRNLDDLHSVVATAEEQNRKLEARNSELEARFKSVTAELSAKNARVEKLQADEAALAHVTVALTEAEQKHQGWVEAVSSLDLKHTEVSAEFQKKSASLVDAQQRLVEAQQRLTEATQQHHETQEHIAQKQTLLSQLQIEHEALGTRLTRLREDNQTAQGQAGDLKDIVAAREDQLHSAEKKLESLERDRAHLQARIDELADVKSRLEDTLAKVVEAESKHASLTGVIAALQRDGERVGNEVAALQAKLAALTEDHGEITSRTAQATEAHKGVESALERIHAERIAHEGDLTTKKRELIAEMQRLDEARAEREKIEGQCRALAETETKLAACTTALNEAEKKREELHVVLDRLEAEREKEKGILDDLVSEEEAARGRLEVLRGREKDLRGELEQLGLNERTQRDKFEEIRKLATEMETAHDSRKVELGRTIEETRRELTEMELKLAPLRDWKDGMDKRYARLAALPEDSAEARDLWREIEGEKANLRGLITTHSGQTRSVSLREAVLKGLNVPPAGEGADKSSKGKLHAPAGLAEDVTQEERANIGSVGTGAMYSGTGQEMALKARLNRLRESVQREALRLEFLRQERAREETRGRGGVPNESLLREQERQMESKVHREEEKLATVERKLEMAEVEEEKRRDRIAEMEQKLAELRADITDAERARSDARQQADLVQMELKNHEAALDRVKKQAE